MRILKFLAAALALSPILIATALDWMNDVRIARKQMEAVAQNAADGLTREPDDEPSAEEAIAAPDIWSEPAQGSFAWRLKNEISKWCTSPPDDTQPDDNPLTRPDSDPRAKYDPLTKSIAAVFDPPEIDLSDVEYVPEEERHKIEKIAFVGNSYFDDMFLAEYAKLEPGAGFYVGDNRTAAARLQKTYQFFGFIHARVSLQQGNAPDDREVVFQIDEGPRVEVTKLHFVGNQEYSAARLLPELRNVPVVHLPGLDDVVLITLDNLLRPYEAIGTNTFALRLFYDNRGYKNVSITPRLVTTNDPSRVEVEYQIDEGEPPIRRGDEPEAVRPRQLIATSENLRHTPNTWERSWFLDMPESKYSSIKLAGVWVPAEKRARVPAASVPAKSTRDKELDFRDIDRLVFHGAESFTTHEIQRFLKGELDLIRAAHPSFGLTTYCDALVHSIKNGYHHRGFRDAKAKVVVNEAEHRLEVTIEEGARIRCGGIIVTGASATQTAAVVRHLEKWTGSSDFEWRVGAFCPFDDATMSELEQRVERAFAKEGFLHPEFELRPGPGSSNQALALLVEVANPGPRAVLGKIAVAGNCRDSEEDLLRVLELSPGSPYDTGLAKRLKKRLWESGRYLGIEVTTCESPAQTGVAERPIDLNIEVQEYDAAPPLAEELPPAKRALIKLQQWITRWSEGKSEEDLVFELAPDVRQGAVPSPQPVRFRLVVSPERGQILSYSVQGRGTDSPIVSSTIAALPDRLVFASLHRQAQVTMPVSGDLRLELSLEGGSRKSKPGAATGGAFYLSSGSRLRHDKTVSHSPLLIEL
jgi:hypothetical protein